MFAVLVVVVAVDAAASAVVCRICYCRLLCLLLFALFFTAVYYRPAVEMRLMVIASRVFGTDVYVNVGLLQIIATIALVIFVAFDKKYH